MHADWLLVFALALPMATLGYADDRQALPVLPRLLGQLGAAAAVMACALVVAGLGLAGAGLLLAPGLLVLAWLINVFNFMDGIDGLAASQAAFMAGAAAWLVAQGAGVGDSALLLGGLAAAALGFLVLNWPPARIFMGDTGSQPLGLLLGAAAAVTVARGELSLTVWAILWASFLADATLTLAAPGLATPAAVAGAPRPCIPAPGASLRRAPAGDAGQHRAEPVLAAAAGGACAPDAPFGRGVRAARVCPRVPGRVAGAAARRARGGGRVRAHREIVCTIAGAARAMRARICVSIGARDERENA